MDERHVQLAEARAAEAKAYETYCYHVNRLGLVYREVRAGNLNHADAEEEIDLLQWRVKNAYETWEHARQTVAGWKSEDIHTRIKAAAARQAA